MYNCDVFSWEDFEYEAAKITSSSGNPLAIHKAQLATAVINNDVDGLKFLLESAGIDFVDGCGNTLIHFAVKSDKIDILNVLLDTPGAPINAKNIEYRMEDTPLMLALRNSREHMAIMLIEKGADVTIVSFNNCGPLYYSISNRMLEVSKLLIERGADINCQDTCIGVTPLIRACELNWEEAVCMLLSYGAEVTIPTTLTGYEPFDNSINIKMILSDYVFDKYKTELKLNTVLSLMEFGFPRMEELFEKTSRIVLSKKDLFYESRRILRAKPQYLKLFIEKFLYAVEYLFSVMDFLDMFTNNFDDRWVDAFEVLFNSPACSCIVASINKWTTRSPSDPNHELFSLGDLLKIFPHENRFLELMSQLLIQGLRINTYDINWAYLKFGFCPLFKQMIIMDFEDVSKKGYWGPITLIPQTKYLMPLLIYDVRMTIERFLADTEDYDTFFLYLVLDQFCHQKFKNFCLGLNNSTLTKKVMEMPQVPLLVELARNASRRHIIEFYAVDNFRHLYEVLEKLPIATDLVRILNYEKKLYE